MAGYPYPQDPATSTERDGKEPPDCTYNLGADPTRCKNNDEPRRPFENILFESSELEVAYPSASAVDSLSTSVSQIWVGCLAQHPCELYQELSFSISMFAAVRP